MVNWLAYGILLCPSFSWWFPSYPLISLFLVLNSSITSEHEVNSSLSISPCNDHELTPSTAYPEHCIWHQALHHPKIDCLPLPASLSSLGGADCTQLSTFPRLPVNQWIESQLPSHLPPDLPPPDRSPPSTPPISIDHGLQVHLQTRSITASKCISELHDHGLQMHLQTRSIAASKCISEFSLITASKCISEFTRSRPPSASPNSLDHGLQVPLWVTWSRPRNASPNSLDLGLQVHLCVTRSPNSLDHDLQVHLWVQLDLGLQVDLWVSRSRPPNASPNSLDLGLQAHLWVQLDLGLQVHLQTRTIAASKYLSQFTWSRPPSASLSSLNQASPGAPAITLQYCLQPDWPHVYL